MRYMAINAPYFIMEEERCQGKRKTPKWIISELLFLPRITKTRTIDTRLCCIEEML